MKALMLDVNKSQLVCELDMPESIPSVGDIFMAPDRTIYQIMQRAYVAEELSALQQPNIIAIGQRSVAIHVELSMVEVRAVTNAEAQ